MAASSMSAHANGEVANLTVPAEYVEDIRAALVSEIKFEADRIADHAMPGRFEEQAEVRFADVRNDVRLMGHDVALFDQLDGVEGDATLTVEGQEALDSLPHAFEAMARLIAPRLAEELDCTPLDQEAASKIRALTDRLARAVDRAADYHEDAARAREGAGA